MKVLYGKQHFFFIILFELFVTDFGHLIITNIITYFGFFITNKSQLYLLLNKYIILYIIIKHN